MLLKLVPLIYRRRSARPGRRRAAPQPAVGPVLVSAAYENIDPSVLTLVFDRAVDLSGLVGADIVVNDNVGTGLLWDATGGVEQPTPMTARLTLTALGGGGPGPLTVTASPANGIVAVADGAAWAGATDLELPFP